LAQSLGTTVASLHAPGASPEDSLDVRASWIIQPRGAPMALTKNLSYRLHFETNGAFLTLI
jgi:hypothetical protein